MNEEGNRQGKKYGYVISRIEMAQVSNFILLMKRIITMWHTSAVGIFAEIC